MSDQIGVTFRVHNPHGAHQVVDVFVGKEAGRGRAGSLTVRTDEVEVLTSLRPPPPGDLVAAARSEHDMTCIDCARAPEDSPVGCSVAELLAILPPTVHRPDPELQDDGD